MPLKETPMRIIHRSPWLLSAVLVCALPLAGQTRRPLEHSDYDVWSRITSQQLSDDGSWIAYQRTPGDGDGLLVLHEVAAGSDVNVPRGSDATFSADMRWVVFSIGPVEATVDSLKLAKTKADELPRDSLGILPLSGDGEAFKIGRVKSFSLPEDGSGWLAYLLEDDLSTPDSAANDEAAEPDEPDEADNDGDKDKEDGTTLVLHNLATGEDYQHHMVSWYAFSPDGTSLFFSTSTSDGTGDGVYRVETPSNGVTVISEGAGTYTQMTLNESGTHVAFLSDRADQSADQPSFSLYLDGDAIVSEGEDGLPEGWWVNSKGEVSFSEDGTRVFFGTQERPAPEDKTETLEDDEVKVDVWNWQDDYMMPMQLLQAEAERDRAFLAVKHLESGKIVQLASPDLQNVTVAEDGDGAIALGTTDLPYRQLISWDGRYQDAYLIDVNTGERELAVKGLRGSGVRISPAGQYLWWWDQDERAWFAMDRSDREPINLTAAIPQPVHDVLDDHPQPPGPIANAVWLDDDAGLLVYDEFDVWLTDPSGDDAPRNVTNGVGRQEGLRFRFARVDPEEDAVPAGEEVLLSAFDTRTKGSGFYRARLDRVGNPEPLLMADALFSTPRRARDSNNLIFTRQSFTEFPDLWVSDLDPASGTRISDVNPQQDEYRWGTVELVDWTSNDRDHLEGMLYKPDDFDPTHQYPMMVYFYERMSDGLNRYHVPAPLGSIINFSFYTSRGYLVFVPDILYEIGHPGESSLDAVVPGVLRIAGMGFVDLDRIGVQGHSWGGYQIAYMITRTNLFAAAEAGAPVVNMTSAYGGIRWGSGMVRQFQYEKSQSRIGGTLWERPLEYLENSPLFQADKINTPLLMMHNDQDTAVPWYQGIEMFSAMRRLQKPAWLINYNGEPHNLRRPANRKDWAIRMQQFFDHYLMDAPAPVWMVDGVPAVLKGTTLGLDLITPKPITEDSVSGGGGGRR